MRKKFNKKKRGKADRTCPACLEQEKRTVPGRSEKKERIAV